MPHEHLLLFLNEQIQCRQQQVEQTVALLDPDIPAIPALILCGQEATGKTLTITNVLSALGSPYAIIKSRECITGRHLMERTVLSCKAAVEEAGYGPFPSIDGRCENLSVLTVLLQQLLTLCRKFVIVFDGIDHQREASSTLLQALARLGEIIPTLTVVFVLTHPRPRHLSLSGCAHISFPPYTRPEALAILSHSPLPIFPPSTLSDFPPQRLQECAEDDAWLYPRFCGTVYDSLGKTTTRSIPELRTLCHTLWPRFVEPIRQGQYGTRNFAQLIVRTRPIFQNEDSLRANLLTTSASASASSSDAPSRARKPQDLLPYYSKYLLIAAYLASYNPPRTDRTFFSKSSEHSKKRRKRRNASSAPGTPSRGTPSKPTTPSKTPGTPSRGTPSKFRRTARKLLGPQPFVLERWLAVFRALVPHDVLQGAADLYTQIATLQALRMVLRVGAGDGMDPAARWRVNVGWEFVGSVGKAVRVEVEEYLAE
ncbi:MAG: hypothetical protein MMC23_008393 [Stictis urceolatum]|nr:hypothetical protein [Stictis urceolata]